MKRQEDLNYIPVSEITDCGNLVTNIMYKPKFAPILCGVFGILMIITMNIAGIILGLFMIMFAVYVTFKVEDYCTMTIYDNCVVLYNTQNKEMGRKINYDDVVEWTVKSGEGISDAVTFTLSTGEIIFKDTFDTSKAYKQLYKIMPKKEKREIQAARNREISNKFKLKFPTFKKKNK